MTVTARGDFPVVGRAIPIEADSLEEITSFPEETRILEVIVEGIGGEELTIGRTREVDFATLEDGDELYVLMAPRRGFCPTGAMGAARAKPLVARAGVGFLVAGGTDEDGDPVDLVERYDPDRGRFVALADSFYAPGLAGASMTTLRDGRVVVAGGPETAYQIYDPVDDSIGQTLFLEGARAHHAAAALPDGRLFLAGGCADTTGGGACDFTQMLTDSILLDIDTGDVTAGPSLAAARAGGFAVVEQDGRVLISGGVDAAGEPVMQAVRVDPLGGAGQGIAAVLGRPATLATGGTLVSFADGLESDAVAVIPAGAGSASAVTSVAAARVGTTVTALDDGAVLAVGGRSLAGPQGLIYSPARQQFGALQGVPFELVDHAAIHLDDGTVVVLGGRDDDDTPRAEAWVYRHDLISEFTGEFNLAGELEADLLSPRNPARVTRETAPVRYTISGSDGPADVPSEWLVAGGPRFVEPTVTVTGGVNRGGLAILVGFESFLEYQFVALRGEAAAELFRVRNGTRERTGCTGDVVDSEAIAADDPMPRFKMIVSEDRLIVTVDEVELLDCDLMDAIPRGLVGVGVLGDSAAEIVVEQVFARR